MDHLGKLTIRGYKSIKDATIELRPLNVLIGANGAGKSNLVSFFRMLNEILGGRLQEFIARSGRAHSLLYHGPRKTPQMEARLDFQTAQGVNSYQARLFYAAGDTLIFAEETAEFHRNGGEREPSRLDFGAGHAEARIREEAERGTPLARTLRHLLVQCRRYHFHDASETARVQQYGYINDDRHLMPDAGNLAAILHRLRELHPAAYRRIVGTVRLIAPYFEDFDLEPAGPAGREIILNWKERSSDQLFGPHQLSDGTLRAICLITLLLQPEDSLPNLIVVDEPELGLHPYALRVVAELFQKASMHCQILISTQSSPFLNEFAPEDVIVVDRGDKGSTFTRQNPETLAAWLDEYSLGEVWEKNVIGGGPH